MAQQLSEESLIERLKEGDEAAFSDLVRLNKDIIYNTALGFLQNDLDAEDIAQEVFIKAFDSISGFKGESKLSTWLYRITVTKCLDLLRSRKRKKRFAYVQSIFGANDELVVQPVDFVHPGVVEERKAHARELFKAIDQLPEQQKIAFVLARVEGLSHKEVGDVMDASVPAVESLLQRAKLNLRRLLTDYYQQHL